jgi:glucokinase
VRDARAAVIAFPERAAALLELAGGDPSAITGPQVTRAAQSGDPLALELFAELGRWIGEGSASVAALLDPELVVLGGGVAEAADLLLPAVRAGFASKLSARGYRPEASFVAASLGNDAGMVGAADLARVD